MKGIDLKNKEKIETFAIKKTVKQKEQIYEIKSEIAPKIEEKCKKIQYVNKFKSSPLTCANAVREQIL